MSKNTKQPGGVLTFALGVKVPRWLRRQIKRGQIFDMGDLAAMGFKKVLGPTGRKFQRQQKKAKP